MKNVANNRFSIALIIIFLMVISFVLGRFSDSQKSSNDIIILNRTDTGEYEGLTYVASKQGSKYYFEWCSGAKKIKSSNIIHFDSQAEAVRSGYEKASNCPGL
jgi:hypothetical protein